MQRAPSRDTSRTERRRPFLARLARDAGGNTLAIVGAALIPLTAMIGSGIDMSRAYMAKTRLQSACDAAALAGRRVMTNDTLSTDVRETATEFFNFNFPQGLYQTAGFTPAITRPDRGVVQVKAATTIPTSIMAMFGFASLPLSVECEASHDFVNTDVVLVLDVTGSMGNRLGGVVKLDSLREAVLALYDELAPVQQQLEANGMRLRYGIVPYSSAVNVGHLLYAQNPNYLVSNWTYQSRQQVRTWLGTTWQQAPRTLDVRNYVAGQTVNVNGLVGTGGNTRWAGCIEERGTLSTINAGGSYTIGNAHDLNLDLIPHNDATRWRPYWPEVVFTGARVDNRPQVACPPQARRLAGMTRAQMNTYLNTLEPDGGTYHDIGMIWGGRFISDQGVFADSPNMFNGMEVNKHVIFMTDGVIDTGETLYSSYGLENLDRRVTGTWSGRPDQRARHEQRFKMACNQIRGKRAMIWVVAFDSTVSPALQECAANPAQVTIASNRQQLIEQFTQIGKNIGALRLTQ